MYEYKCKRKYTTKMQHSELKHAEATKTHNTKQNNTVFNTAVVAEIETKLNIFLSFFLFHSLFDRRKLFLNGGGNEKMI